MSKGKWIVLALALAALGKMDGAVAASGPGPLLQRALSGPLAETPEIVYTARAQYNDGHWYANIGYYCDDETKMARAGDGGPDIGKLYKLNLRTGVRTVIVDDPGGSIRDPQVHYDGKKILFSYRRSGTDFYHLYEVNADGTGLRQLTLGEFDDFEPTYLPDGGIVFVSTRCKRWVNCWMTQVATMFRCDGDGRNIQQLSASNEHDNTPWVLPDGRVLYTRWEYVDRSQVEYHHLWTMNPDGSNQAIFFGNMHAGWLYIDAKPMPDGESVLTTLSPGHGRNEHMGYAGIITPRRGPDDLGSIRTLNAKLIIRDPYPVSEDLFLMAFKNSLVLMGLDGTYETIETVPDVYGLHEPRVIAPRPRERQVVPRSNPAETTGELILADIYEGRNLAGVERGDIKKLLILESLPKPVNFSGGMDTLSWRGTFTLERAVGTVPVEEDGSAYFTLPANRAFLFVALDENDLSVKRMQSFTSVMPGEVQSCVGCHEDRARTPLNSGSQTLLAMQRPPSRIEPFAGYPDVLDFHRDVQPVLDRHCVPCHNFEDHAANISLEGDLGPIYGMSYYALMAHQQVADGRNGLGNQPPRTIGSSASPLLQKLKGGHHNVEATPEEWRTVWLWIEIGAPYVGTYAGIRNAEDQARSQPGIVFGSQKQILDRRCGACHDTKNPGNETGMALPFSPETARNPRGLDRPTAIHERVLLENDPMARLSSGILLNMSRPEKSPMLLAPLAEEAGGWGACGEVFTSTEDPDYHSILSAIRRCKGLVDARPRYATPEFRPNRQYIREMKRYGILPASFDEEKDPIDLFETDQAYWRSLWYVPNSVLPWGPEMPAGEEGAVLRAAARSE